jgi:mannose/fructose/N-acetylgalactosamine-specific phosphotransferase system component IIC
MSYPAYYGQPAMVATYHRSTAPPSVHVVALLQYVSGLVTLLAAGAVAVLTFAGRQAFDDRRIQIPAEVERGLTGAGAIIAGALGFVALLWLVIARKLQRGRQWARVTVVVLSLLSIAATTYDVWRLGDRQLLPSLALPVLYVLLLNTRAARSWFKAHYW